MKISILGIDLGKKAGFCFKDSVGEDYGSFELDEREPYLSLYRYVVNLVDRFKPVAIVVCKSNYFRGRGDYKVVMKHSHYAGIVMLIAEQKGKYAFFMGDKEARKHVFGNGGLKKEEVQKLTGIKDPDASDATVFARAQYQLLLDANK